MAAVEVKKKIVHEGDKWCVRSETTDRSFGCYDTEEQAVERLREVEGHKVDKSVTPEDVPHELVRGTIIEQEHGHPPDAAREIAAANLANNPAFYANIALATKEAYGPPSGGVILEGSEDGNPTPAPGPPRENFVDFVALANIHSPMPGSMHTAEPSSIGPMIKSDAVLPPSARARNSVIALAKALSEDGDRTALVSREVARKLGLKGAVEVAKAESEHWAIALPGGDALAGALELAPTIFWSPLSPSTLFLTTEDVAHSSDARVIAKRGELGGPVCSCSEHPPEPVAKERTVKLCKTGEERYVLGIVLEPGVIDSQGDFYDAAAVREAAHGYMQYHEQIGRQHKELITGKAKILESYLAPVDFEVGGQEVKKGTWLLAIRVIDDDVWADVKSGALTGFSIGGTGVRTAEEAPPGVEPA